MTRIQEQVVDLPSGRFALLRAGSGSRLLILLHGFPDHPPTFEKLICALAEGGYDVAAPWLRGYAPSTLAGPYDVERVAEDALELATQLGRERFVLVGHDWGAISAYAACSLAPSRVAAAVTLAIPHLLTFRGARQALLSAYIPLLAGPFGAELAGAQDFALVDLLWRRWSPSFALDETRRRALHACLRASWPAPVRYYRALLLPSAHSARRLATMPIGVPLLHLHGAEDGCVAAATGQHQARYFSGPFASELCAGAGHFLAAEAPLWVAERTLSWLERYA